MDKTSRQLVDYANSFFESPLGQPATDKATGLLFDTIACGIAGVDSAPGRIMAKVASTTRSTNGATIFGHGFGHSPELAALANATMVRTHDYNDAYYGHPSDMISGILAAGEMAHSPGTQVLQAIALSYEVYGAFSRSGPYHLDSGLDYALCMNMGVALAVGKLWNFTDDQLANAASISLVPNMPMGAVRWGALSMMKGAGTAFAVRNGLFAAILAREGFDSVEEPYEGIFGLKHFTGPFDLRLPLDPGKRVVEMAYIKPIPAENNTIGILEFAPAIAKWCALDDIESIDIDVATGLDVHLADEPKYDPQTRETADHSLPFMLARALVDGGITFDTYTTERIADPALRPLMRKIRVHASADLKAVMKASVDHEAERKPARVTVTTKGGKTMTENLMGHSGHPDRPAALRRKLLDEKLDLCAGEAHMDKARREEVRSTWWAISGCKDVAQALKTMQHFAAKQES